MLTRSPHYKTMRTAPVNSLLTQLFVVNKFVRWNSSAASYINKANQRLDRLNFNNLWADTETASKERLAELHAIGLRLGLIRNRANRKRRLWRRKQIRKNKNQIAVWAQPQLHNLAYTGIMADGYLASSSKEWLKFTFEIAVTTATAMLDTSVHAQGFWAWFQLYILRRRLSEPAAQVLIIKILHDARRHFASADRVVSGSNLRVRRLRGELLAGRKHRQVIWRDRQREILRLLENYSAAYANAPRASLLVWHRFFTKDDWSWFYRLWLQDIAFAGSNDYDEYELLQGHAYELAWPYVEGMINGRWYTDADMWRIKIIRLDPEFLLDYTEADHRFQGQRKQGSRVWQKTRMPRLEPGTHLAHRQLSRLYYERWGDLTVPGYPIPQQFRGFPLSDKEKALYGEIFWYEEELDLPLEYVNNPTRRHKFLRRLFIPKKLELQPRWSILRWWFSPRYYNSWIVNEAWVRRIILLRYERHCPMPISPESFQLRTIWYRNIVRLDENLTENVSFGQYNSHQRHSTIELRRFVTEYKCWFAGTAQRRTILGTKMNETGPKYLLSQKLRVRVEEVPLASQLHATREYLEVTAPISFLSKTADLFLPVLVVLGVDYFIWNLQCKVQTRLNKWMLDSNDVDVPDAYHIWEPSFWAHAPSNMQDWLYTAGVILTAVIFIAFVDYRINFKTGVPLRGLTGFNNKYKKPGLVNISWPRFYAYVSARYAKTKVLRPVRAIHVYWDKFWWRWPCRAHVAKPLKAFYFRFTKQLARLSVFQLVVGKVLATHWIVGRGATGRGLAFTGSRRALRYGQHFTNYSVSRQIGCSLWTQLTQVFVWAAGLSGVILTTLAASHILIGCWEGQLGFQLRYKLFAYRYGFFSWIPTRGRRSFFPRKLYFFWGVPRTRKELEHTPADLIYNLVSSSHWRVYFFVVLVLYWLFSFRLYRGGLYIVLERVLHPVRHPYRWVHKHFGRNAAALLFVIYLFFICIILLVLASSVLTYDRNARYAFKSVHYRYEIDTWLAKLRETDRFWTSSETRWKKGLRREPVSWLTQLCPRAISLGRILAKVRSLSGSIYRLPEKPRRTLMLVFSMFWKQYALASMQTRKYVQFFISKIVQPVYSFSITRCRFVQTAVKSFLNWLRLLLLRCTPRQTHHYNGSRTAVSVLSVLRFRYIKPKRYYFIRNHSSRRYFSTTKIQASTLVTNSR